MKTYYYLEGIEKFGPFTDEELLSKSLSDDVLVLDIETNETIRYGELKKKLSCPVAADDIVNQQKLDKPWLKAIKIVVWIVVVSGFFVPKILTEYYKHKTEALIREMQEKPKGTNSFSETKAYTDGGFSFTYPSTFIIIGDTVILDRRSLMISKKSDESLLLVSYSTIQREYGLLEKNEMAKHELSYLCKKTITNIFPNANFQDIKTVNDQEPVVKYRMDFNCQGYRGRSVSSVGNEYGYTMTFLTTSNDDFDKLSKCVDNIVIK